MNQTLRLKHIPFFSSALAASAPVAQFSAPCDAFGRIVTADYNQAGRECAELIRRSWKAIDTLGNTGEIN